MLNKLINKFYKSTKITLYTVCFLSFARQAIHTYVLFLDYRDKDVHFTNKYYSFLGFRAFKIW